MQLRFEIGAYSPKTMPMARLARYLDNLATVLGETRSVHLVSVDEGSTVPVLAVDPEAYGKVRQRAAEVHNKEAPPGVLKASTVFVVEPFDLKAAIEAAESQRRATDAGSKKSAATGPWQKVKVDRQIGRSSPSPRSTPSMSCTPTTMTCAVLERPRALLFGASPTCPFQPWTRSGTSSPTRRRNLAERGTVHPRSVVLGTA